MLNINLQTHVVPDGCAGQQSNESLKGCYACYFTKHQFAFHFKTFTDDIKMLVVSTKRIRTRLALNILYLNVIANEL